MTHVLAQAIKLPWENGSISVPYPSEFSNFTGKQGNLGAIISTALPIVIGLAGLGLLLMLISAGYTFMTSAGDAKKMESGKHRLTYALVGFLIIFGAYWAVQILGIMFGAEIAPGFK